MFKGLMEQLKEYEGVQAKNKAYRFLVECIQAANRNGKESIVYSTELLQEYGFTEDLIEAGFKLEELDYLGTAIMWGELAEDVLQW